MNSILIIAHKRYHLFADLLKSIFGSSNSENYNFIVVLQRGSAEMELVLEEYKERISTIVETNPLGKSTTENITYNRFLGWNIAFNFYQSDFVVCLEEDVTISKDALLFTEKIYDFYKENRQFRGVNFGSWIPYSPGFEATYSLNRFGIHGPASMITRKTFNRLNQHKLLSRAHRPFDGQIEYILKSGFMVTPNSARYIDHGLEGTHGVSNAGDFYFRGLKESFYSGNALVTYERRDEPPIYRQDCRIYKKRHFFVYLAARILHELSHKSRYIEKVWLRLRDITQI